MSQGFAARHQMAPEVAKMSLAEIADRYVGRFRDKTPDWAAFEDAKIEVQAGPAPVHRRGGVRQA